MCDFIPIIELAKKAKIKIETVRLWEKQGYFPTIKKGSRHFATDLTVEYSKFVRNQKNALSDHKRKAKVITIANNKGGVQKTTTAVNLASILSDLLGAKVLLVDADGQGNASKYSLPPVLDEEENLVPVQINTSLRDILLEQKLNGSVSPTFYKEATYESPFGFDVIPNNIKFNAVRNELESASAKELLLKNALKGVEKDYDYIIVDTPPTLAFEQQNGYYASDFVLIVTNADEFSKDGLEQTFDLFKTAKRANDLYANPKSIELLGVLLTDVDPETNVDKYFIGEIENYCIKNGLSVYEDMIKSTVKVKEAIALKKPVHVHCPDSPATCGYYNLALAIDLTVKKAIVKESIGL